MENKLSTIKVFKGGPLLVEGIFRLVLPNGEEKEVTNPHLCRCGMSNNKPFCDGSHRKSDFDK